MDIIFLNILKGACIIAIICISIIALVSLRYRVIDELPRFLWAILILFMPFFGSIVYFIVHPGEMEIEIAEEIDE